MNLPRLLIHLPALFLALTASAALAPQQVPGLARCYDARTLAGNTPFLPLTGWLDMSHNVNNATNQPSINGSGPTYYPECFHRLPSTAYYRTNYFAIPNSPDLYTSTNCTYFMVARLASRASTSVLFDNTEPVGLYSILNRLQNVSPADVVSAMDRGSNNIANAASSSDWLETFKIMTVLKFGNMITLRINGVMIASNSYATCALTNSQFYTTLGCVHNGSGYGPWMSGNITAFSFFTNTLTADQVSGIEAYYAKTFGIQLGLPVPVRYSGNPVVTQSANNNRMLEPTVLLDNGTWKMWYSGNSNGISNCGEGWAVYYATSPDGTNWTKQGVALTNAWEPDVIKVNGIYYMSHTADSNLAVYVAFSLDGVNWADSYPTAMLDTNNSTWGHLGPRESNLYWENNKFYLFYADANVAGNGTLRIGMATCTGTPTNRANWAPISQPVFMPHMQQYDWNNYTGTESPCVRYYPFLPYPYLMTYIGYNSNDVVVHDTWRDGIAFAPAITGPWHDGRGNPWFGADTNGAWDDAIVAEMTHVATNGYIYFYYSGARAGGSNQVGFVAVPISTVQRMEY